MIEAVVRNKAPVEVRNDEDCLTSTVWGLLKYAPLRPLVARFLCRAISYDNTEKTLGDKVQESQFTTAPFSISFWERTSSYGEPDILIKSGNSAIVVEDKYMAPLSGDDQLQKYGELLVDRYTGYDKSVVYLTAAWDMPINEPIKRPEGMLYWLSWYELHRVASEMKPILEPVAQDMVDDLIQYLKCLGFYYFCGFTISQIYTTDDRFFWDDTIPIITNYEPQPMPKPWFWREKI